MANEYAKGWNAGTRGRWPEHRPPNPPHPVIGDLVRSGQMLRDAADSICSRLCEDDDFVKELGPAIDAFDEAMTKLTRWLKAGAGCAVGGG